MKILVLTGTPRYRNVVLKSMIWYTAILAAVNLDMNVSVYTDACHFKHQSINVLLQRWSIPVTDLPARMSWCKSASVYVTVVTQFPRFWSISWDQFMYIPIHCVTPFKVLIWKIAKIRYQCLNSDGRAWELLKISIYMPQTIIVTLPLCREKEQTLSWLLSAYQSF
jgi:hypothetical protein